MQALGEENSHIVIATSFSFHESFQGLIIFKTCSSEVEMQVHFKLSMNFYI